MKKITMLIAMVFALTTSYGFREEEPVDKRVLSTFEGKFEGATDVVWTVEHNYYEAIFTLHNQRMFAFYRLDGQFLAVTRYISPNALPLLLQSNLKKLMCDYWIADLFEVANEEGTVYYATLRKADSKMILESMPTGNWVVFEKDK